MDLHNHHARTTTTLNFPCPAPSATPSFLRDPGRGLAEVAAAWERARELQEAGYHLDFEPDPLAGGIAAALRTRAGRVVERMTTRTAMLVCCGDALPRHPLAV